MSSRRTATKSETEITRREFYAAVRDHLSQRLPPAFEAFRFQTNQHQIKVFFGQFKLHYEVWTNSRDRHIEIGLHFEEGPESSAHLIRYFDQHILEIKHYLGPDVELERWTNSWGRIYQLLPYQPLTEELAIEIGERLAAMIVTLQPLLDDAIGSSSRR